ncbi:MAG: TlpA disulfide reductase family protein [Sulfurimonas sp.]|nr:TlpA disulfide reductase family protein [Sulfurimonas sp.]MDQ7061648.1 TlpA disulfide reductase family protein [Sulfurimonas sp.]
MIKKSIFIALLSASLVFQACSEKKESDENNSKANAMISTNEYVLTSTDNKQFIVKKELDGFVLEGAKGKVIIFDIFATWCPPCQASASHLTSLQKKFKDDLVIIGITIEDDISNDKLDHFKVQYNGEYTIVNSSANRPLVNAIANALEVGDRFPIPLMAMYKDGKLITHYVGEVQEEFVESDIKRALGK